MKTFLPLSSLFFFLTACFNNADVERAENNDPQGLYKDFQVWAEEGREDVTVRLQFRAGGEDGDAVLMDGPGAVLLDNKPVAADSTRFTGVYYETFQPIHEFEGKHTVVFVDKAKKQQKVEFLFHPFSLAKEIPEKVRKVPFEIQLNNFPEEPTSIRLVMVDTSLFSADVNEEIIVENGKIAITAEYLDKLTKGPVMLEIYREEEKPLNGESRHSGKLTITYSLKREFTLIE
ncbi:MAG TPA: hypothetical protein VGN63_08555 [Flavisolibacter sp.]|jgi:hypothetical protein|nr:hypothetical protein [Flavisolibacter sp.]